MDIASANLDEFGKKGASITWFRYAGLVKFFKRARPSMGWVAVMWEEDCNLVVDCLLHILNL